MRSRPAISRLPHRSSSRASRVSKGSPDLLLIVGIFDETDKSTNFDVSDWLTTNMQDELSRVPGVGDVNVFGSSYAMRIWLDPHKLSSFGLMPSDVITALQNQNTEVAAGEIGGLPQPAGPAARRDGNRAIAAPDARPVPQHRRQVRSDRRAGAARRCRAGRARRRQLFRDDPLQRPPRRGHRHLARAWRERAAHREPGQGQGRRNRAAHAARLQLRLRQRHHATSSSCRSGKW